MAEEQTVENPEVGLPTPQVVEQPEPDKLSLVETRLVQLEERFRNQDKVISRKDAENKRLQEALESRDGDRDLLKAMAIYSSKVGANPNEVEETVRSQKADLTQEFDTIVEKRKKEQLAQKVKDLQSRVVGSGLTEEDPDYWRILGYVMREQWDKAEAQLTKINETKSALKESVIPVKEEKPVVPQIDNEKLIDERVRQELEKRGMLKTDTGTPAGSSGGRIWTMSEVLAIPPNEFYKHFPRGYEEIQEKVKSGQIKV